MPSAWPLISRTDIDAAKKIIASANLRYEDTYDLLVGVFHDYKLVGCGARHGRVLKMLVIDEQHRGGDLLGEIVTELVAGKQTFKAGGHFVFAKPCAIASFERLNFRLLVRHPKMGLGFLESQHGLNQFFRYNASSVQSGNNGVVVINADPFTLGHQYLIEQAAAQVDRLYILVPGEGGFMFSPQVRLTLAREGTRHLNNVCVISAGPYILNQAEFPGYFLNADELKEQVWMEMDAELFVEHIAPFFHITTRFVGTEPMDPLARTYHQILKNRLAEREIRLIEVMRSKIGDHWISADAAHRAIKAGDSDALRAWVPATTSDYLKLISKNPGHSGYQRTDGGGYSHA